MGTLIGLLIGVWQAATSGAWWQVLLWIIIGWMAGSIAGSLGTLALKGATVKELVTYAVCGGLGALIGTWIVFRTLAVYPNSAIWAWVWAIMGVSVGLGVALWINSRRKKSQGA